MLILTNKIFPATKQEHRKRIKHTICHAITEARSKQMRKQSPSFANKQVNRHQFLLYPQKNGRKVEEKWNRSNRLYRLRHRGNRYFNHSNMNWEFYLRLPLPLHFRRYTSAQLDIEKSSHEAIRITDTLPAPSKDTQLVKQRLKIKRE